MPPISTRIAVFKGGNSSLKPYTTRAIVAKLGFLPLIQEINLKSN